MMTHFYHWMFVDSKCSEQLRVPSHTVNDSIRGSRGSALKAVDI